MPDALERRLTGKPVTVTLDGKEYTLAYPVNAAILYEEKTGDNLFLSGNWHKIAPGESPLRFRACLWAGLQTNHPELTIDQVGTMADFSNAHELVEKIAEALTSYFPKKKEASPNDDALEAATLPAAS